jgi:hypothetical protein
MARVSDFDWGVSGRSYTPDGGEFWDIAPRPDPNWLSYVGARVEITGAVRGRKKQNFVKKEC